MICMNVDSRRNVCEAYLQGNDIAIVAEYVEFVLLDVGLKGRLGKI